MHPENRNRHVLAQIGAFVAFSDLMHVKTCKTSVFVHSGLPGLHRGLGERSVAPA